MAPETYSPTGALRVGRVKLACIGCGKCCILQPCNAAINKHGIKLFRNWKGCPELSYRDGRHWCRLWDEVRIRHEGTGCLFPTSDWRSNLWDRREK